MRNTTALQIQAINQGIAYDGFTIVFDHDAVDKSVVYNKQAKTITVTNAAGTSLADLATQISESLTGLFAASVVSGAASTMNDGATGVTRDGVVYDTITVNLATDANGTVTTNVPLGNTTIDVDNTDLPPGATELAASALCPNQAFRLDGRPVWGCQFHVELDEARMLARAALYRDAYLPASDAMKRLADSLRPSPVAATLFARFLALV